MKRNILCVLAIALITFIGCTSIPSPLAAILPAEVTHGIQGMSHVANAATLNESSEDPLGQSVGVSLTNRYHVLNDPALLTYVSFVGLTVAHTSSRPDIKYVFGILDTPEVNAYSGPHGYVFLTRGALANMRDEAELAGVLAHEESHVILHHGLQQVQTAETQAAFSEAFKAVPVTRQFSAVADLSVDAITKTGYSQPQEFAADESAVKLVCAAGYNPESYLHFLQRLSSLQAQGGGVMSTHPGADQRVTKVSAQLQTVPLTGATLAPRFHANVKF